ncbi:UvrD-helicase domain-containing protein [Terrisporobacter vanillatitrophus]|uniref:UvrD-helicase domain-containing protein n=1 Tax=Terrisporobacter vanillatitrophus TaxID=3058402 RepID=UPI003368B7BF
MKYDIEEVKHSLLLFYNTQIPSDEIRNINYLLQKGKKVILFLNKGVESSSINYIQSIDEFKKFYFFQIYKSSRKINCNNFYIIDGNGIDKIEDILEDFERFNFEQYKVEHQNKDTNIVIEAGAGTGKTTVMIDRIMYLLHIDDNLSLNEIEMITFTKDATLNMRHKLQKMLLMKYKLTRNDIYLKYLEQESEMKIQTIHSFAKYLISRLGAILGYGTNVKIKSYKYDREELILDVLDEYIDDGNRDVRDTLKLKLHEFVKIIDLFWNKLENQGITYDEIQVLDWGDEIDDDSKTIHDILKNIFVSLEQRMIELKKKNNAVSLSDITREIDHIINDEKSKFLSGKIDNIKYLFVDEFQDTDNSQINLIKWLYENLDLKLFVVGDIKQSIYRFRGATYTAFQVLKKSITDIETIPLVKNYRTSHSILNKLDKYFSKWNSSDLLVYSKNDKLVPMETINGQFIIKETKEDNIKNVTLEVFNEYTEKLKHKNNDDDLNNKIVALVRTNYQAQNIKEWCDEAGILCYVEVGGTFFISEAVKDIISLVSSYLFQNEPKYKINLINSPYTKHRFDFNWDILLQANGDKNKINLIIDGFLDRYEDEENTYTKYKQLFKTKPVIQVIKQIIDDSDVINTFYNHKRYELAFTGNYDEEYIDERAKLEAKQYYKNLNKLLELIKNNFSDEFCSLYKMYEYLILNLNTNREEDEEELNLDEIENVIYCMTVHKSKGLEFNTVVLPFMNKKFSSNNSLEILVDNTNENKLKVGWNIPFGEGNDRYINSYSNRYHKFELRSSEKDEVAKEETRLLYVAMTRAIKNLICIKVKKKSTWSDLV